MAEYWISSDWHLNHNNILKFTDSEENLIRGNKFSSVKEMNEYILEQHNSCVKPTDHYYNLGDVFFSKDYDYLDKLLSNFNGKKRLVLGNHDDVKNSLLTKHFEKIMIWRVIKEFDVTLSHFPLHDTTLGEHSKLNLHGHIHQNLSPSARHINVSMEAIDYKPIHLETFLQSYRKSLNES